MRINTKTPESEQFFISQKDYSYLRVPVQQAIQNSLEMNPDITTVCLAVTFYNVNP